MASKIDFGSVSYMLGVVSIVLAFFSPFAGLIFGIIGYVQSKRGNYTQSKKMNLIGIIVSIIFIILLLVSIYFYGGGFSLSSLE